MAFHHQLRSRIWVNIQEANVHDVLSPLIFHQKIFEIHIFSSFTFCTHRAEPREFFSVGNARQKWGKFEIYFQCKRLWRNGWVSTNSCYVTFVSALAEYFVYIFGTVGGREQYRHILFRLQKGNKEKESGRGEQNSSTAHVRRTVQHTLFVSVEISVLETLFCVYIVPCELILAKLGDSTWGVCTCSRSRIILLINNLIEVKFNHRGDISTQSGGYFRVNFRKYLTGRLFSVCQPVFLEWCCNWLLCRDLHL
jgi:hypothetical protein